MNKRINFKRYIDRPDIIKVLNEKKEHLGDIEYNHGWECYVFQPEIAIEFSYDCLQEIIDYMKNLN